MVGAQEMIVPDVGLKDAIILKLYQNLNPKEQIPLNKILFA